MLLECNVYRLSDCYKNLLVNEIIYNSSELKEDFSITNKSDIEKFIGIISKGKRTPSKFISLEKFDLKMQEGGVILMNRNDRFIRIDGLSFVLTKKDNAELDSILEKYK